MNEVYKLRDLDEISYKAIEILKKRMDETEELAVAFSGGKTPKRFYELLKNKDLAWKKLHVFFVDDRQVEIDSKESVVNLLNDTLLSHIDIPKENIHFPAHDDNTERRAKDYEKIIKEYFEKSGKRSFDLAFLGMGADGHTASLFHMRQVDQKGMVLPVPKDEKVTMERITLGRDLLVETKELVYLISGENKKEMFEEAIIKKGEYPANKIRHSNTKYFVDFLG